MDICAEFIYICDNLTIVYGIDLDVLPDCVWNLFMHSDLFKCKDDLCFCWFLNFVHDCFLSSISEDYLLRVCICSVQSFSLFLGMLIPVCLHD
jgi:hypothetical protein